MKKTLLALAAAGLAAISCGPGRCQKAQIAEVEKVEEEVMGAWAPIELSKSELTFPRKGGSATVTCRNYDKWWLADVQVCGTEQYTLADPGADNTYLTLNAEGISAEITADNEVLVTVEGGAEARSWNLHLQSGDAFATIHIEKKGAR